MPQLALTDYQLALIKQAAKLVPQDWVTRFQAGVADELLCLRSVGDNNVSEAIQFVLSTMHINPQRCCGGNP